MRASAGGQRGWDPRRPTTTGGWDSRFRIANELSRDPVIDGTRRGVSNRRGAPCANLSPTRPWRER